MICIFAQVYTPNLPTAPALPLSLPPYVPASQPTVQFILQGSLPLASGGVAQSPAPAPAAPTTASEPAGHATVAGNSEERAAAPRPAAEKAKTEEVSVRLPFSGAGSSPQRVPPGPGGHRCPCSQYMKKLHTQERAVEEVKLAIKPFYQKREVTKDEYKDILRKAVQKVGAGGRAPRPGQVSPGAGLCCRPLMRALEGAPARGCAARPGVILV